MDLRFWRENYGFMFLAGKLWVYVFGRKIMGLCFWWKIMGLYFLVEKLRVYFFLILSFVYLRNLEKYYFY